MKHLFIEKHHHFYAQLFKYNARLLEIAATPSSLEDALIALSELTIETDGLLSVPSLKDNLDFQAAIWFFKADIYAAGLVLAKNEKDDEVVRCNYEQIEECLDYIEDIDAKYASMKLIKDSDFIAQFNSYGFYDTGAVRNLLEKEILPDLSLETKYSAAAASSP